MKLGPMTRKWLVTIIIAIIVALVAVWLYTAYAAEQVEPEVAEDEVSLVPPPAPPTSLGAAA